MYGGGIRMTCREARALIAREGRGDSPSARHEALARHLLACQQCGEAMKVSSLSSVLLGALRGEIEPGPTFYPRLRARLAPAGMVQPDAALLQVWGFARRLVPALALGVLLLAGVTISLGPALPERMVAGKEIHAFSLEELNLPAAVERPNQDQMLAFVLMQGEARGAGSGLPGPAPGK